MRFRRHVTVIDSSSAIASHDHEDMACGLLHLYQLKEGCSYTMHCYVVFSFHASCDLLHKHAWWTAVVHLRETRRMWVLSHADGNMEVSSQHPVGASCWQVAVLISCACRTNANSTHAGGAFEEGLLRASNRPGSG